MQEPATWLTFVIACLLAELPNVALGQFQTTIKETDNDVYSLSCLEEVGHDGDYNSDTWTETTEAQWRCVNSQDCANNIWKLFFDRHETNHSDPNHTHVDLDPTDNFDFYAWGGRCRTSESNQIVGNGTFTARIYIHSNVETADGVLGVGLGPSIWRPTTELDLVVLNLDPGKVKFGQYKHSMELNVAGSSSPAYDSFEAEWITVEMVKTGYACTFTVRPDSGDPINVNFVTNQGRPRYCNFHSVQNLIAVNSRGDEYTSDAGSHVTFAEIKWDANLPVQLHEVESSGGASGEWIELHNTGSTAINIGNYVLKDEDPSHSYTIPSGTTIAAGGFLTINESAFQFALNTNDSVRLFTSGGTLVDTFTWIGHASTTFSRCPPQIISTHNAGQWDEYSIFTDPFVSNRPITKNAANNCP